MTIEWNDSLLIGDNVIDTQHKKLFDIINTFLLAEKKADLHHCAMDMYDYIKYHFHHEEKLMREIRYPDYVRHLALHNNLIFALNKVSLAISDNTLDKDKIEAFVTLWLRQHIPAEDIKIAQYIKRVTL